MNLPNSSHAHGASIHACPRVIPRRKKLMVKRENWSGCGQDDAKTGERQSLQIIECDQVRTSYTPTPSHAALSQEDYTKSSLMKEKSHIRSYSFISICGGANGQAEKIFGELKEISGLKPSNVKELWVNNLLPADKKDTIKNTSGYRIVPADLQKFRNEIDEFLRKVEQPAFSPK